jgi:hypothetical protein
MALPQVPEGLKVRYEHTETYITPYGRQFDESRRATLAYIYDLTKPEEGMLTFGFAVCNPRDQYCKRIGRTIALGRALKKLKVTA